MADSGRTVFGYGGASASGGFRVPSNGEHALSVGFGSTLAVPSTTIVQVVFDSEDSTGDPLAAGTFDPGQGVTLQADHKTVHFDATGWWYCAWQATLTADSDAVASVIPTAGSLALIEAPSPIKAGVSTRIAGCVPIFCQLDAAGPGIALHSISGDVSCTFASLYLWRLDAPYEGV